MQPLKHPQTSPLQALAATCSLLDVNKQVYIPLSGRELSSPFHQKQYQLVSVCILKQFQQTESIAKNQFHWFACCWSKGDSVHRDHFISVSHSHITVLKAIFFRVSLWIHHFSHSTSESQKNQIYVPRIQPHVPTELGHPGSKWLLDLKKQCKAASTPHWTACSSQI